jgi:hydroxymethylglutaryl-CoA synthase
MLQRKESPPFWGEDDPFTQNNKESGRKEAKLVGITSFGAYIPLFRLDKKVIRGKGEKAICNFDEDSVTMAVEAISDCLKGAKRDTVDALYFGTTTSVYKEHSGATTIAMASNFREDAYTAEFGGSLRAGTAALKAGIDAVKAGSAKTAMVAAADCRMGVPGTSLEQNFGDGAAAFLIGDTDVAAEIVAEYSVYSEIMDLWRIDADRFVSNWEDRFVVEQGYLPTMGKAITGIMAKYNYKPSDFAKVIFYSGADQRRCAELAKALKFDTQKQLQNPMMENIGDTGSASVPMLLAAALEEAKKDDLILVASYGNGADAFVFRVTEHIGKISGKSLGINKHLASKRIMTNYMKYLEWRALLPTGNTAGPHAAYSAVAAKREYHKSIGLYGSKCKACGYVQYPPQRVCTHCQTKDQMEPYSFVDRIGKIFTYNLDYITPRVEVPTVTVEVDFEGGGRIQCYLTEVDVDKVAIDVPVVMTFRRNRLWEQIGLREGVYIYFWEAKPLRA